MGLMADRNIAQAIDTGHVRLAPYDSRRLGPASYDVSLSSIFRLPRPGLHRIDLAEVPEDHTMLVRLQPQDTLTIHPGQFCLASTVEHLTLGQGYAARYEGRSSLGRLGLASHITAGFIDPGFAGNVTLEIANHSPWELVLHPGMRIGQLCFFRLQGPANHSYAERGHYQDQEGPVESRFRL